MKLKERLAFCVKCQKRSFEMERGIVCSLTGEKPEFENECSDYLRDEAVMDKPLESSEDLEPAQLIEMLDSEIIEKLRLEQSFLLGVVGGIAMGIIGAVLWGVISVATNYQIGYMAVAIGIGVGFAIRILGRGVDHIFGIAGAVIALLSCLLGNFFMIVGFISKEFGIGFWETMRLIDLNDIPTIMIDTFDFIDIVFYALALTTGYKFAFRKVSEQKIDELVQGN